MIVASCARSRNASELANSTYHSRPAVMSDLNGMIRAPVVPPAVRAMRFASARVEAVSLSLVLSTFAAAVAHTPEDALLLLLPNRIRSALATRNALRCAAVAEL